MTKNLPNPKNYGENYATLYSLANEFLDAARSLQTSRGNNIDSAIYFLLAHSSELMLKSFLCKKGESIRTLKSIGHNIEELLSRSIKCDFPSDLELTHVLLLADNYKAKKFEYRSMESMSLPHIYPLTKEIDKLGSVVYDYII